MKSRTMIAAFLAMMVVVLQACYSPVIRTGNGASVTLAINGLVIPSTRIDGSFSSAGSRLILPTTTRVKIDVTGPDNFAKSIEAGLGAGLNTITVPDLPVGKELNFTISTLDAAGGELTKAVVKKVLETGQNTLSATLLPDPDKVLAVPLSDISSNVWMPIQSAVTLAPGEYKLYKVSYSTNAETERQIQFDSQEFRWPWVGVYDENWAPLPVITADAALGWAVVKLPAGSGIVHVAVANIVPPNVSSAGPLTGQLGLRQCVFLASGASGNGTSQSPANFETSNFSSYSNNSVFIQSGTYMMNPGLYISGSGSYFVYGGFTPDWKARTGKTELVLQNGSSSPEAIYITGCNVFFDMLEIGIESLALATFDRMGIHAYTNAQVRLFRSTIMGSRDKVQRTVSSWIKSIGVKISDNSVLKIAHSTVSGGYANLDCPGYETTTYGVYISSSNGYTLSIESSSIDGGTAISQQKDATAVGIRNDGIDPPGTIVINRSAVYGGVAKTLFSSTYAKTFGIDNIFSLNLYILNSVISGGQAVSFQSAETYAVRTLGNSSLCISGNVIDTGGTQSFGAEEVAGVSISGSQTVNSVVACNVFITTEPAGGSSYGTGTAAFYEVNTSFSSYKLENVASNMFITSTSGGFYSISPYGYYGVNNAGSYGITSAYVQDVSSYTALFEQFAVPAGDEFERFRVWRAGNLWKVKAAFGAWLQNPVTVAVPPFVNTALQSAGINPNMLYFDLAGNPRPASGIWKIGAFE